MHSGPPPPANDSRAETRSAPRGSGGPPLDFVAEDDRWEAFYHERERNEDDHGWKKSRFHHGRASEPLAPQTHRAEPRRSPRRHQRQAREEENSAASQNDEGGPEVGRSLAISPVSAVPLSQLILSPRSERLGGNDKGPPSTSQRSAINPMSSVPLSQLISGGGGSPGRNPPELAAGSHHRTTSAQAQFRLPFQEGERHRQGEDAADTSLAQDGDDRENVSKERFSFQEMTQSQFREPYRGHSP